ncbi:MAG: hypothetical protein IJL69_03730 [Oscillospiraceae bacterium]|jgi:hypothetical protein|nr:hypothetical protein [Oscillospiraceae bacterium]
MKTGKGAFAVKALVLLVWMILISALESSVMVHLKILGQVPKGLPFVVAAAAVLDGPMAGVLAGAAAGFFADGVAGQSFCLYSVVYLVGGAAVGALSQEVFRRSFLTAIGWGAALYGIGEFLRFFLFYYLFGRAGWGAVLTVILPGLLYSLLISPLAVGPSFILRRCFKTEAPLIR